MGNVNIAQDPSILPTVKQISTPYKMYLVGTFEGAQEITGCEWLNREKQLILTSSGYRKVICPFGIAIAATAGFPYTYMYLAANFVANIIDADGDGKPDNQALFDYMKEGRIIVAGETQDQEDASDTWVPGLFTSVWKMNSYSGKSGSENELRMQREIFKMISYYGWSEQYPNQFGVGDYTSEVCTRMTQIQCDNPGWFHPENECTTPGTQQTQMLVGSCLKAWCNCSEFFYQAVTIHNEGSLGWKSSTLPSDKGQLDALLGSPFINLISEGQYGIPATKMTGYYNYPHFQAGTNATKLMATGIAALGMTISLI